MSENRVIISSCTQMTFMMNIMKQAREVGHLTDVTIFGISGNNGVKAHKIILSAYSPFFYGLFEAMPAGQPFLILPETETLDIQRVVEYIYSGVAIVNITKLSSFIKLAKKLEVIGLKDIEEDGDMTNLSGPGPTIKIEIMDSDGSDSTNEDE